MCAAYESCYLLTLRALVQVNSMIKQLPNHIHGYVYTVLTSGSATVLGIALYGWSVWRTL